VLTGALNQDIWVLRNLGFTADPIATGGTSALNNPSAPDPLAGYDVVFNTAGWPAGTTARARLTAFFAAHGGYIGAGTGGASFLTSAAQVAGLTAASRGGNGRSGIVYWDNLGGANSPVVGRTRRRTRRSDPPTWFTSTGPLSVDARFRTRASSRPACGCSTRSRRRAGLGGDRARDEHLRLREGDRLCDEPALPGRPGT
jgi:hypothetical protein